MSDYTPEEVDMLIEMLRSKLKTSKPKIALDARQTMNKIERTIRYLEQRHKFFNPTKQMLEYIVNIAENSDLDPNLVKKMKEDLLTKR